MTQADMSAEAREGEPSQTPRFVTSDDVSDVWFPGIVFRAMAFGSCKSRERLGNL